MENQSILITSNKKLNFNSLRFKRMDAMKSIACIGVVYIHTPFPGIIGNYITVINRYAVPFFFFVSGFFFLDSKLSITNKKIIHKINHILILLRNSGTFYFIFFLIYSFLENKTFNIKTFTIKLMNKKNIIGFLLFNHPFIYKHFWFLLSLLYCYLFMLLINSLNRKIINKCLFEYFFLFFGITGFHLLTEFRNVKLIKIINKQYNFSISLSHFFMFRAFPLFLIGIIIKRKGQKSLKYPYLLCILFIIGSFLACFEMYYFKIVILLYIGTYIQLISVISLCLEKSTNNKFFAIISDFGRELSDYIYIYHIAVRNVISLIFDKNKIINKKNILFIKFPIVLLITIIFSYILKTIIKKIKNYKN